MDFLWPTDTTWVPHVPDSIDGAPLATKIYHLVPGFRYENLPENPYVAFFLRPEVVFAMVGLYLLSKPVCKAMAKYVDGDAIWFRSFVAVHNLGLAIFSGIVAWNSWGIVINHLLKDGFMSMYCDVSGNLWREGLGVWAVIFYLSKFYEFVDTWILLLKGKTPSFLQVYHHTGIVITMWGGVISHSSWLLNVVLLNSFIHIPMYTYFFIKTISPKTQIKAAKYLTLAQIGQFYTGLIFSIGMLFMGDSCVSESTRFMMFVIHAYAYGLIALFTSFAAKKYKKV